MLRAIHFVIVAVYVVVPIGALIYALAGQKRGDRAGRERMGGLLVTSAAALAMGITLCLIYGKALQGRASIAQVLLASYFGLAMLLILRGFDTGLRGGLRRLFGLTKLEEGGMLKRIGASLAVAVVWVGIMVGIGIPYVVAVSLTYRPKVTTDANPQSRYGLDYQPVSFTTSDGVKLSGWWIPAAAPDNRDDWDGWGNQTAIVCHDLFGGKATLLPLGKRLANRGFNVLTFDFRAHGTSGGQLSGFGALEKRDVLAGVEWVRQQHPRESKRICGVGVGMGADALISAAADHDASGQSIAALAVYSPYDDPATMVKEMSLAYAPAPLGWLIDHIGLPIASLHAGVDLVHYSPVTQVSRLWPRPILFIQGEQDEVIPFERSRAVYDAADQPKYRLWFSQGTHREVVKNETASAVVVEFFRTAHSVPVI